MQTKIRERHYIRQESKSSTDLIMRTRHRLEMPGSFQDIIRHDKKQTGAKAQTYSQTNPVHG